MSSSFIIIFFCVSELYQRFHFSICLHCFEIKDKKCMAKDIRFHLLSLFYQKQQFLLPLFILFPYFGVKVLIYAMKVISAFGFHFLSVIVSFPFPYFILLLSCFYWVARSFEIYYEDYGINNSGFSLGFGVLPMAHRIFESEFAFLSFC